MEGTPAWTMAGYDLDTEAYSPTPVPDFGETIPGNPDLIDTIDEVKAGLTGTLKSMLFFLHEHPQSPYGLRISERNFSMDNEGKVESIPFYGIKTWLASPEKKSRVRLKVRSSSKPFLPNFLDHAVSSR